MIKNNNSDFNVNNDYSFLMKFGEITKEQLDIIRNKPLKQKEVLKNDKEK